MIGDPLLETVEYAASDGVVRGGESLLVVVPCERLGVGPVAALRCFASAVLPTSLGTRVVTPWPE